MTRWLVTGTNGFIGSHFVDRIDPDTNTVVTVNAHSYVNAQPNRRWESVFGDITDGPLIDTIIGRYRPDIVVAFAAESSVSDSFRRPRSFIDTNIAGPVTIMDAIRRHSPATRYVHVSTDEVYGPTQHADIGSPLEPANPYAVTKAAADHMIDVYTDAYDMATLIVRPTNNWGPRQALPKFIPAVLHAKRTGEPMTLNDPATERDWLCVFDNVRAIHDLAVMGATGVWNISTHRHASLRDIIDRVGDVPYRLGSDRPINDQRYMVASSDTWDALGWTPTPWIDDARFDEYVEANT